MQFDYTDLKRLIVYKYGTHEDFAKAANIGRVSLSHRLNNKLPFTQREIFKMVNLLGIKKDEVWSYFFTEEVQKHEQN